MNKVKIDQSIIQGQGVFATLDIPKGDVVLKIDDSRVVTEDNPLRPENGEYEHHCDYLAGGKVVLMQPPECYINHSCNPNTYVKTVDGIRKVFALCNIRSGEEITYDYCINGFDNVVWTCNCGSPCCRHTIHSDFFHLPLDLQLEYLPLLDSWYVEEYREQVEELRHKHTQKNVYY